MHFVCFYYKNRTTALVLLHRHEGLLKITQSTLVFTSIPVVLRAWKMTGKSTLCCFDPCFLDFVVNVLEETSKNERTKDNFQESFHNTESEEEASDDKSSDCNNSNDNNGEDGYFSAKNFVWSKTGRSQNFRTRIHNIVSRLRGPTTK